MLESLVTTATVATATISAAASSTDTSSLAGIITTVVPSMIASALPSGVTTTAAVATTVVKVPLAYDLIAAFVGGLSGATHAVNRHMDISGVVTLAIVNALGGGILRDVLLQDRGIAAFQNWRLLSVALAAALFGFFFSSVYRRMQSSFLYLDALSLGLFAVVGADKALGANLGPIPAILLGVVTSVGGGMIRDVLCNETPQIMRPGTLSASAAALGSTAYVLMVDWMHIVKPAALLVAVGIAIVLRVLAVKRDWHAPTPVDLRPVPGRPWRLMRRDDAS